MKRTIFTLDYINKKNFLHKKINISNFNLKLNEIEKLYKYNNPKIILSYLDSIFYMRNQLLRDSDWASMYHGVELRTPFVDSHLLKKLSSIMISYSSLKNKEYLKNSFKSILPLQFYTKKKNWISNTPEKMDKKLF